MENVLNASVDYRLVNLTPHVMSMYNPLDDTLMFTMDSEGLARVSQTTTPLTQISVGGYVVDTGVNQFGEVEGLPAPQNGVLYFVSAMVATRAWAAGRVDVVCPLEYKRSEGRIEGIYSLQFNPSLAR